MPGVIKKFLDTSLSTLTYLVPVFVGAELHARDIGMADFIEQFVEQTESSNQIIADALTQMKADYLSTAALMPNLQVYDLSIANNADKSSKYYAVNKVQYGYVSDTSEWQVAGADNIGMFAIEVTFRSASEMPGVHPLLAGKTVLLIPYGSGPDYKTIFTNSTTAGTANLNDTSMNSITGVHCFLKNARCTAATGSHPAKTCTQTVAVNASALPGVYTQQTSVNFFNYTHGLLSSCAESSAQRNSMGI